MTRCFHGIKQTRDASNPCVLCAESAKMRHAARHSLPSGCRCLDNLNCPIHGEGAGGFTWIPRGVEVENSECDNLKCNERLGTGHWWSHSRTDEFFCSVGCLLVSSS